MISEWMAAVVPVLGNALLDFLWQGAAIGIGAWLILKALRDASPQSRYAVACFALLACACAPIAGFVSDQRSIQDSQPATIAMLNKPVFSIPAQALFDESWAMRWQRGLPWIVAFWSIGAGLLLLRVTVGLIWIERLHRQTSSPICEDWRARLDRLGRRVGLRRRVELKVGAGIFGPIAIGILRPTVLVPAAVFAKMPTDLLEALLAHELAHIRRHDYLINLLQSIVEALLFYHPAVWWLSHRVRIERELVADDIAAAALGEPRKLAIALAELERFDPAEQPSISLAFAQAAQGGQLMSRIQRLLRPSRQSLSASFALPLIGLAAVGIACFAYAKTDRPRTAQVATHDQAHQSIAGNNAAQQGHGRRPMPAPVANGESSVTGLVLNNKDLGDETPVDPLLDNQTPVDLDADDLPSIEASMDEPTAEDMTDSIPVETDTNVDITVTPTAPIAPTAAIVPATPIAPIVPTKNAASMRRALALGAGRDDGDFAIVRKGSDSITMSGDTDDIAEINAAKSRIDGDFLWFRRNGKSYVLRDPAALQRINEAWKPSETNSAKMSALSKQMEAHGNQIQALSAKLAAGHEALAKQQAAAATRGSIAQIQKLAHQQQMLGLQQAKIAERDAQRALAGKPTDDGREAQAIGERMEALGNQMEALQTRLDAETSAIETKMAPLQEDLEAQIERASAPMEALGKQMELLGDEQAKIAESANRKVQEEIDRALREKSAEPAPTGHRRQ